MTKIAPILMALMAIVSPHERQRRAFGRGRADHITSVDLGAVSTIRDGSWKSNKEASMHAAPKPLPRCVTIQSP